MNNVNRQFLTALRAALAGEQADITLSDAQWAALLRQAQTHKVLPLVFQAVHHCPSLAGQHLLPLRQQVKQQVVFQTLRTGEFLTLYRKLREEGLRPLVVKGLICRSLYPHPDHRPSGDEDMLAGPGQFDRCCRVLTEQGMEAAGGDSPDAYEISFRQPGSPLYIELHRTLFPSSSAAYGHLNDFFDGVFDRAVEVEVQGERVLTMAPTDHLFYLICHALKHFLHSGFGIRQVCDIVLFANRWSAEVDWQRIMTNCEAIRAEKFAAAVFRIGENHLGMPAPAVFRAVVTDEEPMLSDLLEGGLYGDATMSRKHSSSITLDAAAARQSGKRPRGTLRTSVFPPAGTLAGKYPYLKDKPYLLPLAWGQRLFRYSRETRSTRNNSAAEAMKIGAERVELLRRYGILE